MLKQATTNKTIYLHLHYYTTVTAAAAFVLVAAVIIVVVLACLLVSVTATTTADMCVCVCVYKYYNTLNIYITQWVFLSFSLFSSWVLQVNSSTINYLIHTIYLALLQMWVQYVSISTYLLIYICVYSKLKWQQTEEEGEERVLDICFAFTWICSWV